MPILIVFNVNVIVLFECYCGIVKKKNCTFCFIQTEILCLIICVVVVAVSCFNDVGMWLQSLIAIYFIFDYWYNNMMYFQILFDDEGLTFALPVLRLIWVRVVYFNEICDSASRKTVGCTNRQCQVKDG